MSHGIFYETISQQFVQFLKCRIWPSRQLFVVAASLWTLLAMSDFDMSAWCAAMLADPGTDPAVTTGTGAASSDHLPHPPPLPAVAVPLSDSLTAVLLPNCPSPRRVGAASSPTSAQLDLSQVTSFQDAPVQTPRPWETWERDPVTDQWAPHIAELVQPLRQLRGSWLRGARCATLFGALSSERHVLQTFAIPAEWMFTCDKKPTAVSFNEKNFARATCHFLDGLDFLQSDLGKE